MKKMFYVLGIILFFCGCGDENRDRESSSFYEYAYGHILSVKTAAENGDPDAQYHLARAKECGRHNGQDVGRDCEEAIKWYCKAAEQGKWEAATRLGDIYYEGLSGVKQSYGKAMAWYRTWFLLRGKTTTTFISDDYKYWGRIGDCFYNGWGCKQSYKKALYWYAKCNDAKGWYSIGRCYYYGHGVKQSYEEAIKWLRKAADKEYSSAQELLGICYIKGHGVQQSYKDAVWWFNKAVEKSSGVAQYYLGLCYLKGEGIGQSVSGARNLFETAASKGYVKAKTIMGCWCYRDYERDGHEQSLMDAVDWFREAAALGDAYAQHNLGFCYEYGIGVNQSFAEAKSWYAQAENRGYDPKNDWLLLEKEKMTDLFEFAREEMTSAQKTYIEIGEVLKKQRENMDKLREVLDEFASTNYQMDADYQRLISQCQELKKLQESIVDSIRKTYIAAAKYEASMGEKQEQNLRKQAIENGIREAEMATRRFEEMKQNK